MISFKKWEKKFQQQDNFYVALFFFKTENLFPVDLVVEMHMAISYYNFLVLKCSSIIYLYFYRKQLIQIILIKLEVILVVCFCH